MIKPKDVKMRWYWPVISLAENGWTKALIASIAGLISMRLELVVLVVVLVIVDFVTGLWGAWKRGEAVTSSGIRGTFIKIIEYTVMLGCCVMIGNAYPNVMSWLIPTSFLFVALTELKSIMENTLTPGGTASKVWRLLSREMSQRGQSVFEKNQRDKVKEKVNKDEQ